MAKRVLPVVQTAGLCKTFKDFWRRPKVEAVKDLSLEIRPGEVFGLLGPNGSGKSTAIKMLLGLLYPTKGRISVFGRPPTDVAVKSRIGFLPEESYLYRFLVASETLDYYGRIFRIPRVIREDRIERLLDMVGLRHEAKRPLGEYSKGMARRIGLAQALINDPEFLILDEPTAGLDPIGARQIKDVIRSLGNKGKTVLLSSHMLADVEDVCDRVTILYGGQQRAIGDIGELLRKRDVTQITTPALSEETLQQVRELIQRLESKDIVNVSNPRDKLEDFFLRIVQEAQEARIRTSGALSGTAVPDFLSKATETTTHEIVESLVSAASVQPKPVSAGQGPVDARHREPEPSEEVIGQLLGTTKEEEPTEEEPANVPEAIPEAARPTVEADEGVIQELLGDSSPGNEKKNKD
jgi:ABC-2 type transport system ATP-binding protein